MNNRWKSEASVRRIAFSRTFTMTDSAISVTELRLSAAELGDISGRSEIGLSDPVWDVNGAIQAPELPFGARQT